MGHNRSRLYISNKKRCSYKVISSWWDIAVSNAVKVHHKNRGAVSTVPKQMLLLYRQLSHPKQVLGGLMSSLKRI